MSQDHIDNDEQSPRSQPTEFEFVNTAKVYTSLHNGQKVRYDIFGSGTIEIDEENLDLDRVGLETLQAGWERDKESFTKRCRKAGIDMDAFEVYKLFQIQAKVLGLLGPVSEEAAGYKGRRKLGDSFRLSEAKGQALCSEQAILAAYIAQKIGESFRLIVGMSPVKQEAGQVWREGHMYVWLDKHNAVLDITPVRQPSELPALMVPTQSGATFDTMRKGFDIECQRIGTDQKHVYGLDAGGFGTTLYEAKQ